MGDEQDTLSLSRKERERLAHRREILDAAERVFARSGYHAATVEEIAQEAEFAVGTLYNFFKSKHDLYEQVLAGLIEGFMAAFRDRVLSCADPAEAIGRVIELRLAALEQHRGFARVLFATTMDDHIEPGTGLPEQCRSLFDEAIAGVRGIFERGIRDGLFVEADPLYLTLSLNGTLNAFTGYWARQEPAEPLDERVRKLRELFLGGILRPRATERRA